MEPQSFIEISYEVGNKVGGIHQVLKSKARKMKERYGENYVTIGYWDEENSRDEFLPRDCPTYAKEVKDIEGVKVKCGAWSVPGSPRTLLVKPEDMEEDIDEIKEELWKEHGIDSIDAGGDFDEPVKWAYAVSKVVEKLEKELEGETVIQAHEWLSGPVILNSDNPSVFTTHATVLGRTLSNSDYDLRSSIEQGEVDGSLAPKYGVKAKHQMEKAAAENSDVFTTVSESTGEEATAVLGLSPDIILPNGFNVNDFPSLEELSYQHTRKKKKLKEFLRAYFRPYYDVDLENDPRILFTSGRYEFKNKGLDLFIDALSEINKKEGEEFFVFILVPSSTKGPNKDILENMSLYEELEDYVEEATPRIRSEILNSLTSGSEVKKSLKDLFKENSDTIKSLQRSFQTKEGNPPLSAFELDYPDDEILNSLWEGGLRNREEDRVKVVFYPTYLSVGDRLLSMDYEDFIVASSGGIFPSFYEPWGYTPVETAANGALSVTTDMSGFGQFLMEKTSKEERKGIQILERRKKDYPEVVEHLASTIEDFISYPKTEITERKHNARKLAQLTSWDRLAENYFQAHRQALNNR